MTCEAILVPRRVWGRKGSEVVAVGLRKGPLVDLANAVGIERRDLEVFLLDFREAAGVDFETATWYVREAEQRDNSEICKGKGVGRDPFMVHDLAALMSTNTPYSRERRQVEFERLPTLGQ